MDDAPSSTSSPRIDMLQFLKLDSVSESPDAKPGRGVVKILSS